VQARGLLGDDAPHESFEEMAADFLVEIRQVQPRGPYLLAGFCSGGTAAYEMAQQLGAAGEPTGRVVMLDTFAPDWRDTLTRRDNLKFHLHNLIDSGTGYIDQWARARARWELKLMRERLGLDRPLSGPAIFRGQAIFQATERAEARYRPRPYPGAIALFRPRIDDRVYLGRDRILNRNKRFVRFDNGWLPHVPHLRIEEIAADPGDHDGFVLEPAVRDLAAKLRRFLESSAG
jgi:thioesterase domain-containing protein